MVSSKLSAVFRNARVVLAVAAILVSTGPSLITSPALGQQTYRRGIVFPVSLQWTKQKGVTRYRLQIAADEKFQDVFFDGSVVGTRYVVSNLSPGYYYWRVAPADSEVGSFSRPARFFLSGGVVTSVRPGNRGSGAR